MRKFVASLVLAASVLAVPAVVEAIEPQPAPGCVLITRRGVQYWLCPVTR